MKNVPDVKLGIIAVSHCARSLFEVFRYLGVKDISYNRPRTLPYPTENPWS